MEIFGLLSVRRLKSIAHPTVCVTLMTENYQTLFTPGAQSSFSTLFLNFFSGPADFSVDLYTKTIIRKVTCLPNRVRVECFFFILVRSQLSVWLVLYHNIAWRALVMFCGSKIVIFSSGVLFAPRFVTIDQIIFIFCWPCISTWFCLMTNLTHSFSMYLFQRLYMFRASSARHQEDQLLLIHHLV